MHDETGFESQSDPKRKYGYHLESANDQTDLDLMCLEG
jgi:hypothetical protein